MTDMMESKRGKGRVVGLAGRLGLLGWGFEIPSTTGIAVTRITLPWVACYVIVCYY